MNLTTVARAGQARPGAVRAVDPRVVTATQAEWTRWSTTMRVVVTDPEALGTALEIVDAVLDDVERASSRFRADSEVCRLAAGDGSPTVISGVLAELLDAALDAARRTGGAVDPTLGNALLDLGYDASIEVLRGDENGRGREDVPDAPSVGTRPAALWRRIHFDPDTRELRMPAGLLLDLGATAKAWAADRAADLVFLETGTSVLVSLGGDIATAGPGPDGGWQVLVQDRPDDPAAHISLPGGLGLATSSTQQRRWVSEGREVHHVLDPATRKPVPETWRCVTVAASSCLDANVWSTAALVAGPSAPSVLAAQGVLARLLGSRGETRYVGAWPREAELAA